MISIKNHNGLSSDKDQGSVVGLVIRIRDKIILVCLLTKIKDHSGLCSDNVLGSSYEFY